MTKKALIISLIIILVVAVLFVVFRKTEVQQPENKKVAVDATNTVTATKNCAELKDSHSGKYVDVPDTNLQKVGEAGTYYKDECHVFFGTGGLDALLVPNADPATFVVVAAEVFGKKCDWPENCIQVEIAKDKNSVYSKDIIISEADPASFKIFQDSKGQTTQYASDSKNVYTIDTFTGAHVLEGVDLTTFHVLDRETAQDSKNTWVNGQIK